VKDGGLKMQLGISRVSAATETPIIVVDQLLLICRVLFLRYHYYRAWLSSAFYHSVSALVIASASSAHLVIPHSLTEQLTRFFTVSQIPPTPRITFQRTEF